MAEIRKYFEQLMQIGASDLHLVAQRPAMYRASGHITPIPGAPVLEDQLLRKMLQSVVTDLQWKRFEEEHDLDFAIALEGLARFRGNYFMQHNGVGAVFRVVPDAIVPLEKLGVPPVVHTLADLESGMVLVTGPTGSGKSTTLAAIIDHINRSRPRHIVTVEDPVEFVHQNQQSVLSHREVGKDTNNFSNALRAAMRQDADVVLVGEMRDLETISLAVEAAAMGLLVFGTLHTNSAAKTVDRIIDTFPAEQQEQARSGLADSLSAVVSQILIRRKDGGRVAAHEILLRTQGLSGAIREGNTAMINSVIAAGKSLGMQTMDGALMNLVNSGVIDGHDAYLKASDKKAFSQYAG